MTRHERAIGLDAVPVIEKKFRNTAVRGEHPQSCTILGSGAFAPIPIATAYRGTQAARLRLFRQHLKHAQG